jgi:hypothetical protein
MTEPPGLSVVWADDFEQYAGGEIPADEIRCVLCRVVPCGCPPFGTPEYLAFVERVHG